MVQLLLLAAAACLAVQVEGGCKAEWAGDGWCDFKPEVRCGRGTAQQRGEREG